MRGLVRARHQAAVVMGTAVAGMEAVAQGEEVEEEKTKEEAEALLPWPVPPWRPLVHNEG